VQIDEWDSNFGDAALDVRRSSPQGRSGNLMTEATVPESPPLPGSTVQAEFLGHPRGLSVLFATEMWERFSYYGMRALLVLYMVKYVLAPDTAGQVIGLAALKRALEALLGPLDIQPLASNIYGLYTGLVYLTPVFGGIVADRVLGHRRTVIIGALLMALGHFMMAFEPLLLFALLFLILGNGAFKPNTSSQVGELYRPGDPRRDRAYSIFYVGINIGAFLAPLVCGTLGERVGWHYGFGAAGVGMLIGLATYLAGSSHLPPDPLPIKEARPAEPRYSEGSATQQSDRSRQQPTSVGEVIAVVGPAFSANPDSPHARARTRADRPPPRSRALPRLPPTTCGEPALPQRRESFRPRACGRHRGRVAPHIAPPMPTTGCAAPHLVRPTMPPRMRVSRTARRPQCRLPPQ
jgi:POT family